MSETTTPETFAERLRRLMTTAGIGTQTALETRSGIERSIISRILANKVFPTPYQVECLATAVKVTVDILMDGIVLPPRARPAFERAREAANRLCLAEVTRDQAVTELDHLTTNLAKAEAANHVLTAQVERERSTIQHLTTQLSREQGEREREREEERAARLGSETVATNHLRNVEEYAVAQRTLANAKIATLTTDLGRVLAHNREVEAAANTLRKHLHALHQQLASEQSKKAVTALFAGLAGAALGRSMD